MNILLTGATGFIGKVVLATLLRDRERLGLQRLSLLIRPRRGQTPEQRFEHELASSVCLGAVCLGATGLPRELITLVSGDVSAPELGLSEAAASRLRDETTHVIHIAASIDFDAPLEQAAQANVSSALAVLEFARSCQRLERLVHTSTAYVTPHRRGPIAEELASPACDPEATWRELQQELPGDPARAARLLQQSGHPNTYTFTKCLAEHLLVARRGHVPLSLVRPSIVSAAWRFPLRGWVDSHAAYTGFVALYLLGQLDVIVADPEVRLDIVPVDIVAERLVQAARSSVPLEISHAVAGLQRSRPVRDLEPSARRVKRQLPTGVRQARLRLRPAGLAFELDDLISHRIPFAVADGWLRWRGAHGARQQLGRLRRATARLQGSFAHFSRREYDFVEQEPWSWPRGFEARDYHAAIVEGVYTHLLRWDARAVRIGGRTQHLAEGVWSWATRNSVRATPPRRLQLAALRGLLRVAAASVTYDRRSFDPVLAALQGRPDAKVALVPPSRRSLDAWLCKYLAFDQESLELAPGLLAPAQGFESWLARRTSACLLVPIAISHDRSPPPAAKRRALPLGRIHLRAGAPLLLEPGSLAASAVLEELQRAMASAERQ